VVVHASSPGLPIAVASANASSSSVSSTVSNQTSA